MVFPRVGEVKEWAAGATVRRFFTVISTVPKGIQFPDSSTPTDALPTRKLRDMDISRGNGGQPVEPA